MTRIFTTTLFLTMATTAAKADPGHLEAAGHGHSHWLAYGILAGVTAIAAGVWLARAAAKTKDA